ncbi:MAG: adenosine deaminase [Chitinophagales bacterium]|jgi:adenosine deaminase|nr:adenosine deaminase [Chitinophagales bacterium]
MMSSLYIQMPKAELHLHIEGSLEAELLLKLAQRNNISLPYKKVDDIHRALNFRCLQDFLDLYYYGTNVLIEQDDFFELTYAYFKRCSEQGIVHAEIMFDPQSHTNRGISFDKVIMGISNACQQAKLDFGISSALILSFLRHLTEEDAFRTLKQAEKYRDKITAIGLDSSELDNPPIKFKQVYQEAKNQGYRLTAHAGEEGPVDYIWQAIEILGVERIDHGNACIEDHALRQTLINYQIPLTLCPTSNVALKVISDIKHHPVLDLLHQGLLVTINSDDPAYFGGYLDENYALVQNNLGATEQDLSLLARNSIVASMLNEAEKQKHLTFFKL